MTISSRLGAKRSIWGPKRTGARRIGSRVAGTVGALALGLILSLSLGATSSPASAATAPIAVDQCNNSVANNAAAHAVACDVTVTNTLNIATGETSSVTVTNACDGSANTLPLTCVTTTTPSTALVLSVTQCNGNVNAGGSNLVCTVRVTNNIVGTASTTPATVNQCVGSGAAGTQPTLECDPANASTTGATIDQCNGSANGGGAPTRVICTVSPSTETAVLRVMVNQCNGSANGGGSTVTCSVSMQNLITPAVIASPTPTPGPAASTTGSTASTTGGTAATVVPTASLANTGADSLPSAFIAGLAILFGAGVIVLRRRLAPKGAGNDEGPRRS
ncbi:MAG: hypothetical protein QOI70_1324 [Microbacteriaceae bacterium]|nr:hypothetical protein [Microbacteriaceae bacterium]